MTTADTLIKTLNLQPHPEGGHYRETWRAEAAAGQRPSGTAILFLLKAGEVSHWHRVDATEIWHFHHGAPIALGISPTDTGPAHETLLGPDIIKGQSPQVIVPPHHWQSARSTGAFTLVSCTVSPGFQFDGFTLAPPDFEIPFECPRR